MTVGEPFSCVERVRFGDIDALGHMNNVAFLRFYETGRIAYFRAVIPEYDPVRGGAVAVIFAECQIAYRSPAQLDEPIRTSILPTDLTRSSVRLGFEMHCEDDGRTLADGSGVIVGYDYQAGHPAPWAAEVRDRLSSTLIG